MADKIIVNHLTAWFGAVRGVHDISMNIQDGNITAIIGPSGCGKSTFVRCLNRMHEVIVGARAEGEVLLDDENIYAPEVDPVQVRRRIGMVFQKPTPFPTMSIEDNVAAGPEAQRRQPQPLGKRSGRRAMPQAGGAVGRG